MSKSYISPEEIEVKSQKFLSTYHPKDTIPVPIEEIIEFDLGIDIVPTPDMMTVSGVDAFTSYGFTQINIDKNQLEKTPNRARFTLAHEVGHLVLHKDFITSINFKNENEWKKFVLNDLHRDPMEVQANMFAAFVLIPTDHLVKEYQTEKTILSQRSEFKTKKLPDDRVLSPYLAKPLALKFDVSEKTMSFRIANWISRGK